MQGILLADTKFEFGWHEAGCCLPTKPSRPIPRAMAARLLHARRSAKSFDKQFVRDYLETLDWNKQPPAPPLPEDVIARTPRNIGSLRAHHRKGL